MMTYTDEFFLRGVLQMQEADEVSAVVKDAVAKGLSAADIWDSVRTVREKHKAISRKIFAKPPVKKPRAKGRVTK